MVQEGWAAACVGRFIKTFWERRVGLGHNLISLKKLAALFLFWGTCLPQFGWDLAITLAVFIYSFLFQFGKLNCFMGGKASTGAVAGKWWPKTGDRRNVHAALEVISWAMRRAICRVQRTNSSSSHRKMPLAAGWFLTAHGRFWRRSCSRRFPKVELTGTWLLICLL